MTDFLLVVYKKFIVYTRQMLQSYNLRVLVAGTCILLVACNIILTLNFLHSKDCTKLKVSINPSESITVQSKICSPINKLTEETASDTVAFSYMDLEVCRHDNQRLYKYFDFAIIGRKFREFSENSNVCLATQSSIERLYSIIEVADHWNGQISAAVFAAGDDEFYILQIYTTYLRHCFSAVKDSVSFHLALPKKRLPSMRIKAKFDFKKFDCGKPDLTLKELLKLRTPNTLKWRLKNEYPQNHLRNLARKGCTSDNVFLTDIDIIPSYNMSHQLEIFFNKVKCTKLCAYVIPTFEIDVRVQYPNDKRDLIRLVRKGLARPFHEKVFIYNQYATNFSRWQKDMRTEVDVHISHNVTNYEFLYEPFYIAKDNVPPHDERFIGYGFTRNSQAYEMFLAGYNFLVLSPIFNCHWGLQQRKSRPGWREQQNNINSKHFEVFKNELLARYKKKT